MFGTVTQIIAWQPPDWPPLHNLLLGLWRLLAGPLPFALRMSSTLAFLPAVALAYRAAYRLFGSRKAAWGTAVVYAALGLSIYLSTFIRAYVFTMALFPLAIWLMLRYFDRPGWRRALPLALTLVAMFYLTYTAVFAFAILGLYTLLARPRQMSRWILPALMALPLALPEFLRKPDFFLGRVSSAANTLSDIGPLGQTLLEIYADYAGQAYVVWLLLALVALVLIVRRGRRLNRALWWVLLAVALGPLSLYLLAQIKIFYFLAPRYSWWALLMIALALGYGLAAVPHRWWLGTGLLLLVMMFTLPLTAHYKGNHTRPFEENFRWLQQQVEPGDVMLVDPNFCLRECNEADSWSYYYDVYLRDRLEIVTEPGDYRRIWYVTEDGHEDPALQASVQAARIPSVYVGPWDFLIRLYAGPPDPEGVLFENGMRFHGFDVIDQGRMMRPPYEWRERDTATVRLWWSADEPLTADYSVSLQVYDAQRGHLVGQADGAPALIHLDPVDNSPLPAQTSQWEPGHYYVDERTISFGDFGSESYSTLSLTVYQWWDGQRIAAPGVDADTLLPLTRVLIWGWG
jgi:hypothetical protein